MDIINMALLGLDILVFVSLFFALLFGLIRGFGKTVNKIIIYLIPVCLLFIFLKPISNSVINKEIIIPNNIVEVLPEEVKTELGDELTAPISIKKLIVKTISANVYPDDPSLRESSELAEAVTAASEMLIMVVVYLVGLIFIFFAKIIISLIFFIIRKILRIKIKRKAHLLGMAAGLANFAITFILIYLPIYGLLSLSSTLIKDLNYYQTELNLDQEQVEVIETANEDDEMLLIAEAIDNSFVKKYLLSPISYVVCKDQGTTFDAIYVGNALTFETENGKVKFYDEYKVIKDAFPTIVKIYNITSTLNDEQKIIKLSDLTESDIDHLAAILKNSNLLRVAFPAIVEVSLYNLNKESENSETLLRLKDVNWDQELNAVAGIIEVLKEHLELEIDTTSFETAIASPGFDLLLKDIIYETLNLTSITEVVLPMMVEVLEVELTKQEEFSKYNLDLSGLKEIDFTNEAKGLVDSIFSIYQIYLDLDINFSDLKVALNNELLPTKIIEAFNAIKESSIITNTIIPIAIEYAVIKLKEEQGLDINYETLKEVSWHDNLSSIGNALKEVIEAYQNLEIDPENFKDVINKENLPTELDDVVDTILAVEVIKEYLLPIVMNLVCDKLSEEEALKDFNLNFDEIKKAAWKTEIIAFKDTFNAFIKMYQELAIDPDHWTDILDNPNLASYINDIMEQVLKSEIIENYVIPNFADKLNASLSKNENFDLSFIGEIITKENMVTLLTEDIDSLISIMQDLNEMKVFKKEQEPIDFSDENVQNAVTHMIKTFFSLEVVEGKEANIFDGLLKMADLNTKLEEIGILVNYDNVTNWDTEIDNLCNLFQKMMKLNGNLTDLNFEELIAEGKSPEEKALITDIIVCFAESQIFGDSIYNVIEHAISSYSDEYQITFTDEDKNAIKNETTWRKEIQIIFEILEDAKPLMDASDYQTLDPELVKTIMTKASEVVIASKIVGYELNKLFEGIIDADFTNRQTIKENINVVYDTIRLSNMINEPDFDLNNKENVNELITTINNFASDEHNVEVATKLLNEVIAPEANLEITQESITNAASTFEEVIDVYQASENQETFSKEDLPEDLATKLENDELLKAIWDYFFE